MKRLSSRNVLDTMDLSIRAPPKYLLGEASCTGRSSAASASPGGLAELQKISMSSLGSGEAGCGDSDSAASSSGVLSAISRIKTSVDLRPLRACSRETVHRLVFKRCTVGEVMRQARSGPHNYLLYGDPKWIVARFPRHF